MIDRIDESQADVGVIVGHEHDVKELLALGVNLPQLRVHSLQSLRTRANRSEFSSMQSVWAGI